MFRNIFFSLPSGSLEELREDLKISLFDEVIETNLNEDAPVRNVDLYQRIQNNWLAEYRLPLSSLIDNKVEKWRNDFRKPNRILLLLPSSLKAFWS